MSPKTEAILKRLTSLHPKLIDLSLARIEELLAALGHPQGKLPPVVHVAGTNGKGSVIAFLRALLEGAGYRVHVYVSPHLIRFNERICLGGRPIADQDLIDLLEECESANRGKPITFFEITTAAGFLAFSRVPADILLLETGLGGRLDATNIVARPALTVITPISIDHTHYLGSTLAAIAGEKAGILKSGVPGVISAQKEEAAMVIEDRALKLGAPLSRFGREWRVNPVEDPGPQDAMSFRGNRLSLNLPRPGLAGFHQVENAGTALACLEQLADFPVEEAAVRRGLISVEWPGRLQRLGKGPMTELLPEGFELWLDGGHNPGAGEALAQAAETWRERPLHIIYGMLKSKDPKGFLRPLAPYARSFRAIHIPGENASFSAEEAAAAARDGDLAARPSQNLEAALAEIAAETRDPARVLICGSLYLAGVVLRKNGR